MSSVCSFHLRGVCRFGSRCWNSHDLDSHRPDSSNYRSFAFDTDEEEDGIDFIPTPSTFATAAAVAAVAACGPVRSRRREQVQQPRPNTSVLNQPNVTQVKWTLTNNFTGETSQGDHEFILNETLKKLNETEEALKKVHQQLRIKNSTANFSLMEHQVEQSVESDLQCNICYELFIKPTVLNCSHTFCQECIDSWTRRVNQCPICRVVVKTKSHCLTLDTFLDKIAECLPEEVKTRRDLVKLERQNTRALETTSRSRNNRNNLRRRNNRNQHSMRRTLGLLWGERGREGAEWNIALEESLFDPIRLGDVLGRTRHDRRDGWDDNFSDSSLDRALFFSGWI